MLLVNGEPLGVNGLRMCLNAPINVNPVGKGGGGEGSVGKG